MTEIVREFLIETNENLAQLDQDLVTLEKDPAERETLARVFRTLHTVKGTAGFLGLPKLQAVAHAGENLLSRIRAGELAFTPDTATAMLGVVDSIREMLAALESNDNEGEGHYTALIQTLERLAQASGAKPAAPPPPVVVGPVRFQVSESPPPAPAVAPQAPAAPPPPPPPAPVPVATLVSQEAIEPRTSAVSDSSLRVDVGLLDKLMTLVGELVLARNQIVQFGVTQEDPSFLATTQRLNLLTTELQVGVMKTRMQPIGNVWSKFPRIVRDLAVACSKQVRIDMDGQETELDKTIMEAIRDPLTHMVRNAVDHGIEIPSERTMRGKPPEGRLLLTASHEGGKVVIELTDDGGGIDPIKVRDKAIRANLITADQAARMSERELVNLVFAPGFSTADRVTHFSGRGVGMDVVRTNVEKIGGTVDIESRPGRGTTVKMKIPLTLAIIPALIVTSGGDRYCIPQVSLLELVRLEGERVRKEVEYLHGVPVYRLRGNLLPLVHLHEQLKVDSSRSEGSDLNVVVLQADDRPFGLVVDDIHDTEEIVVKPLSRQIKGLPAFAGATILGDGRVALILDVLGLAQRSGVVSGVRERTMTETEEGAEKAAERQPVLLFATPSGGRMAIPLDAVARLEEFPRSALERVGGQDVVQYRGEILRMIHVARALRTESRPKARRTDAPRKPRDENVQVVVFARGSLRIGMIVGRILDILDEPIASRSASSRPGVLFTAVVQDRVTEFLDVDSLLKHAAVEA